MSSCFQTVFCCWKSTSNRLFYQNNNDSDERGIEYDRLIELPEVDDRSTGRTPAPKLVLNERERHLISNRLYSEYADDQERFNRLADEELHKDEERLAMQEEELYAQRTSKIREFYQNRPPSTSLGETQNFADFSQRFNEHQTPENEQPVYDSVPTVSYSVPIVPNSVPTVSDNNLVSDDALVKDDYCVNVVTEVPDSITFLQNVDHVTAPVISEEVLSVQQSDKLLQDIDDILLDKMSESSDISQFYPEHFSDPDPDALSDISPDIPDSNLDISDNTADYFLTSDILDDSPGNFVEVPPLGTNKVVTFETEELEQVSTFDPFLQFTKKSSDNSSEESFVKIE
ncbi:uncharacterized protein LOC134824095 isoform X1 [Bolinopsis microptera]|uniref:uncharacterized protein LOC134824095 isoform X1 n=1 Tax=Bolinopsis microptera TaxID=2820187 RepID=UPI00307ACC9D